MPTPTRTTRTPSKHKAWSQLPPHAGLCPTVLSCGMLGIIAPKAGMKSSSRSACGPLLPHASTRASSYCSISILMASMLDPGEYDPLPVLPRHEHVATQPPNPVLVRWFSLLAYSCIVSLPILRIPIRLPTHHCGVRLSQCHTPLLHPSPLSLSCTYPRSHLLLLQFGRRAHFCMAPLPVL